ncbi:MAG TPA: response regulator, partial [Herpetosiphonaceae bacterium]|nr:response regulator [Herpetosiphonaceae bacterium]
MSYPELHDALHILIIDDDAVDRRALLRALRAGDSQWTLWEAADRDAAFGLLQHQPMDGILLDYQLPGTDGGAVLHELRARGVHAPVVVVTGQGDEEIAVALMKAGAADYLVKGRITPEVLIRSLRHTIRVAQTEHALRTATSQRDQAEAALAHSEQVLATILRGIGDAVIATDAAKRVIFLNPMAEHLTGWSASEAHGQDFAQVLPLRDVVADHPLAGPPDATAILGTRVVIARALAAPPRGAPFPLAGTCAPIGGAMNDGAVMVFHDMTDHVRTEERLQLLADISHALAASLDPQDSLMRVAELLAGRLADSCAIDLLHPDGTLESVAIQHGAGMAPAAAAEFADRHRRMAKALAQPAREDVETGGAHTAVTVTWLSLPLMAHGDLCGVLSLERATPFRDAERQTATEIAQRSALAVKHALLYQTAHAAVQVRDTFLSIAAHELKTPLTTLSGYIQLLQRRMARIAGIEERDYRALALIADQAHRLNRMIQSLFDVSRLQLGQLTIERAPLDLGALAMRVIQEIEPT